MTHPFAAYFKKHQRYPRIRITSGVQQITISFAPGYVSIRASAPFAGEIYITRSAFLKLLPKVVPFARRWAAHPDFDVPQAVHLAHVEEMRSIQELREQKRLRRRTLGEQKAAEVKRRRYLRAQARAAARRTKT